MPGVRHTSNTKAAIIRNFANVGRVDEACRLAGVNRETHYRWIKTDPKYRADFELAKEQAMDTLEDEVFLRARDGVWTPVFHQGVAVAHVREHSDTLAMFLLKAHRPAKFRDRYDVQHSGSINVVNLVQSIVGDAAAPDVDS